jgi:hypothetical protein
MKDCAHVPELGGQQLPTAAKTRPTIEELREYLDYEPETGVLRWKKSPNPRIRQGQLTGATARNSQGYKQVRFCGHALLLHRVAFALHHGHWPVPCCDHIDGNPLNNRAKNLRECSLAANQHNRRISSNNTTGVKGVRQIKGAYEARVRINGVTYTKYFRRLEDAAAYVKQLREQLHGEFARHE